MIITLDAWPIANIEIVAISVSNGPLEIVFKGFDEDLHVSLVGKGVVVETTEGRVDCAQLYQEMEEHCVEIEKRKI